MQTIAVLMTCHNRREKTLACLTALYRNTLPTGCTLTVFLVDDGSRDGTSEAVLDNYPDVNIIRGDGNLYWCGGMRAAFNAALNQRFDAYLLLNDDTMLFSTALNCLLDSYKYALTMEARPSMVVGSVVDPVTAALTYGGRISRGWMQPLYYDFVPPVSSPITCDTANANCLLVPSNIVEAIGNLDAVFTHGKADYDYGLRAKRKGFKTFVANAVVGECSDNPAEDPSKFNKLSLKQKWRYLTSPKQYPLYEWLIFTWRHAGVFWPFHWLRPYRRLFK
jgi:GT2 family glycosyltransferase